MDLNQKRVVITGAAMGIGKAILTELLKEDVTIVAVDKLDKKEIMVDSKVTPYKCDVSDKEELDRLFDFCIKQMGGIDLFIANAGFGYLEKIEDADWEHIDKIYRTNVYSPIYSHERMIELNRDKESMTVIIASAVGQIPMPGYALYSSTKHALNGFARSFEYENLDGNKLSVVYPIGVKTNFFRNAAGGKDNPVLPKPFQEPETVAKAVMKGIRNDKNRVDTSVLFKIYHHVFGVIQNTIEYIYSKGMQEKLMNWVDNNRKR